MTSETSFATDFLAGAVASAVSKTIIAPIERIKLLLQLQASSTQMEGVKPYAGIRDAFKRINAEQGFASFWRGNMANVVRYFPTQAFSLAVKDQFRKLNRWDSKKQPGMFFFGNFISGGCAGALTTVVAYPLDFARTRVGTDVGGKGKARQFNGMIDCMRSVWAKEGVTGLYRGMAISIPAFFLYRGYYFGLYDTGKVLILNENSGWATKWLWAQFVSMTGNIIAYPMDTIRRRLMMQAARETIQYTSSLDCLQKIVRNEGGVSALYKGGLTNVLRASGGALVLVLYDAIRDSIKK